MGRRTLSGLLLSTGLLAAGLAFGAWSLTRTVLDTAAGGELAQALLDAPAVEDALTRDLERQVQAALADDSEVPVDAATVEAATRAVLADPRFEAAFTETVESVHRIVLGDPDADDTLDVGALTAAVRDALAEADPALAAQMPAGEEIELELDAAGLPRLGDASGTVRAVALLASLAALALLASGCWCAPSRGRALRRIGRRVALLGAIPVLFAVGAPIVLRSVGGDWAATVAPVAGLLLARVVPGALALAIAGVAVWAVGRAVTRAESDRGDEDERATPHPSGPPVPVPAPRRSPSPSIPERLYL